MALITLDEVIKPAMLYAAWEKVLSNQGVGGVDHESLEDFELSLEQNLTSLANEVRYGTYRPLPLLRVEIDKPSGGKRPLSIPTIRDRVLQTAISLVLTPAFEEEFESVSFAYRRGRSVKQAVNLIERLRDKGFKWVVDADIHRYFDEVDHQLLMEEVKKLITDEGILMLIQQWLDAVIVDGNQRYRLTKGIPQGSPLSPLLANLYLDHLDETLLDNNYRLVRYADDFIVLCKSAEKANDALELTQAVLSDLRLSFNKRKTRVVDFNEGFHFLGVQFIRSLAIKSKEQTPQTFFKVAEEVEGHLAEATPEPALIKHQTIKSEVPESTNWYSYALPSGTAYTSSANMREAFLASGIVAGQLPSEQEPEVVLSPPELDEATEVSENNDPRLKTLYLMEHGSVLGKEYERFIVKKKGLVVKEIPAIHVDQIMVFGNSQLTTQVMQFCLQQRIPIYLLSGKGRYYGMVDSFDTEPVLLHREQFLRADDPAFCLRLAKGFIVGKISNSRLVLKRHARHRDAPELEKAAEQLSQVLKQLDAATTLDQLRGYEGNAARIYFQAIAASVSAKWEFTRRVKQPPTDPINSLFSYGYTLLFYNVYTFLRARGLNPHVGYLHPMRMGHPALASDVMEEFRSIVVDAVILNLVFNDKLTPDDFTLPEQVGEACMLTPKARGMFIRQLENKLNSAVTHPISGLKLDYRRCIEHQVNHLAAVVRQREQTYQAVIMR